MVQKNNKPSGQVALVMVLVVTVLSAFVITYASKVTTRSRVQQLKSDSTSAFLLAQSAIEEAISSGNSVTRDLGDGKSYSVTKVESEGGAITKKGMVAGDVIEVGLSGTEGLTGFKLHWLNSASPEVAVLVTLFSDSGVSETAYDISGTDGYTVPNSGEVFGGIQYQYGTTLSLSTQTKIKIAILGGVSADLALEPVGGLFSSQSVKYRSSATLGLGSEKIVYGLEYDEENSEKLPEIFDYSIFTLGTITK